MVSSQCSHWHWERERGRKVLTGHERCIRAASRDIGETVREVVP